ncbi:MAG: hypothetical protein AB1696_25845 [Planctomycetota bacterium]
MTDVKFPDPYDLLVIAMAGVALIHGIGEIIWNKLPPLKFASIRKPPASWGWGWELALVLFFFDLCIGGVYVLARSVFPKCPYLSDGYSDLALWCAVALACFSGAFASLWVMLRYGGRPFVSARKEKEMALSRPSNRDET